jgi:hypothetical protein
MNTLFTVQEIRELINKDEQMPSHMLAKLTNRGKYAHSNFTKVLALHFSPELLQKFESTYKGDNGHGLVTYMLPMSAALYLAEYVYPHCTGLYASIKHAMRNEMLGDVYEVPEIHQNTGKLADGTFPPRIPKEGGEYNGDFLMDSYLHAYSPDQVNVNPIEDSLHNSLFTKIGEAHKKIAELNVELQGYFEELANM